MKIGIPCGQTAPASQSPPNSTAVSNAETRRADDRRATRRESRAPRTGRQGFNRTELLAAIAVLMGLAVLWANTGHKRSTATREISCLGNLKQIGAAISVYSGENRGKLPFAFMQPKPGAPVTWDRQISTALRVALRGESLDAPPPPVGLALRCPEDTISASTVATENPPARRSYSMTEHKMNRPNWPPSEYNTTGVGLFWSAYRKKGNSSYAYLETAPRLPAVSMDMILDGAGTIVVTEQATAENHAGKPKFSTVRSTIEQVDETVLPANSYHGGKINYLMADGHVELLQRKATVGPEGEVSDSADTHFGMWTIAAGD